jgi:hypothetical protein
MEISEIYLRILLKFLPILRLLFPILVKLLPFYERFIPVFASYFLRRILKSWKTQGLVDDYKVDIARTDKFHYKIEIGIVLTTEQVGIMLDHLVTEVLRRLKI